MGQVGLDNTGDNTKPKTPPIDETTPLLHAAVSQEVYQRTDQPWRATYGQSSTRLYR